MEVDIEPFKGMLLGLFFISVGMRIDPLSVAREPLLLGLSILGMAFLKVAVVGGLARLFGLSWPVAVEASLLLAGGGEFAFLVLGLAGSGGLLPADIEQFMLLVASGTMLLTPFLARLGRQAGRQARRVAAMADGHGEPAPAEVGRTIVVGYGRVGRLVCELIEGEGRAFIATDRNADIVASGRKAGQPVVYGDATRREFLRKCGLADAPAVVVTMDDPDAAEHVVAAVRAERADVPVVARARDAAHAVRLFPARRHRRGARGAGSQPRPRQRRAADARRLARRGARHHPRQARAAQGAAARRPAGGVTEIKAPRRHPQTAASASPIAASAASAFAPSGPPACAMSGRPPPPLPPSASAPLRTRSTALKCRVRSSVTPTTMPALPSSATPTIATTPEPICFLPSSARLLRSRMLDAGARAAPAA